MLSFSRSASPRLVCAFGTLLVAAFPAAAARPLQSDFIRVDAFGYETFEEKVAVLRSPEVGFDSAQSFAPGGLVEVIDETTGAVIYSGLPTAWNGGATHATSGDRAWSFDFSAVRAPGTYRIRDAASSQSSEAFEVKGDALAAPRRAALRMFYYQRSGFAKVAPFADPRWADGASHLGPEQDLDCRSVANPNGAGLDLSGGWFDAGDYNKYVNFTDDVIQQLLAAYQVNPDAWDDQAGLPESGNGVPDLLDEVRFGLEWMLRMQRPSGGLLHKVSVTDYSGMSPPSADSAPRRYAPVTASATASGAAAFARAAVVYRALGTASEVAFAGQLEAAALLAWSWLAQNPAFSSYDNAGFLNVDAEDPAWHQGMVRVNAAVWLAHLTGSPAYHAYVAANYLAYPEYELGTSGWSSPYQSVFTEALLRYAELPSADAGVRQDVRSRFLASMRFAWLSAVEDERDPYRAWLSAGDHVWGSSRTLAAVGVMHAEAALLDPCDAAWHAQASRDYAHHFHGVNARGFTYLSNMGELGAENSVQEIYHAWFADGTVWDRATSSTPGPAPGYLVGGPNQTYAPEPAYTGGPIEPPMNQPPAKSYLDWNAGWPVASWSVTEPSTGYQAAYLQLLAYVAPGRALGESDSGAYCPGEVNSTGRRTHVRTTGSASISQNHLGLGLDCGPGPTFGLFFYGPGTQRVPAGNGAVCVTFPRRIAPVISIDSAGTSSLQLNLAAAPFASGPSAVAVGETWFFQAWHRDSVGAGFGTSDGVRVTFRP